MKLRNSVFSAIWIALITTTAFPMLLDYDPMIIENTGENPANANGRSSSSTSSPSYNSNNPKKIVLYGTDGHVDISRDIACTSPTIKKILEDNADPSDGVFVPCSQKNLLKIVALIDLIDLWKKMKVRSNQNIIKKLAKIYEKYDLQDIIEIKATANYLGLSLLSRAFEKQSIR